MQNLCIGQPVWFERYAELTYVVRPGTEDKTDEYKFPQHWDRAVAYHDCEHTWGVISGKAIRYTGAYESYRKIYNVDPDSDVGNYLANPKRVVLWEVKTGMASKPVLVADEDIKLRAINNLCERYPSLPLIGPRVKRKPENANQ